MNMECQNVNEDLFGFQDEAFDKKINSIMGVTNISSRGSNQGGNSGRTMQSSLKRPRQKGPMDHFFTSNVEVVVQNQKSGRMNQTTIQ